MSEEKILVFTKNWIGDLIMQTPCFRILKENFPNSRIVCVVPNRSKWIPDNNVFVDEVIVFNEKQDRSWFKRLAFILQLRRQKFSRAYLLHRSTTRAFFLSLAGIPIRVGYATKRRFRFLTHPIPESDLHHQTDYFVNLLKQAGLKVPEQYYCEFFPRQEDVKQAKQLLERLFSSHSKSVIAVNPGANWDEKRWPREYFARLCDLFFEHYGVDIVITGSKKDQVLANEIIRNTKKSNPISCCGLTHFGDLGALFSECQFVVTADSGPMHIASASGARTIALFGPTDAKETVARGRGEVCLIEAENKQMESITPEKVFETIVEKGWIQTPEKKEVTAQSEIIIGDET